MNRKPGSWRILSLVLVLFVLLGCGSLGSIQPTKTPVSPANGKGSASGNGSGTGSGDSNNNANPGNPTSLPTLQDTATPEITLTPASFAGPYTVRQTMTLGKETLGTPPGGICINAPWQVPVDTLPASFEFVFGAYSLQPGSTANTFAYAYQIPSAGESHDAKGSYTLSPNKDGSLKVSLTASDHVVFTGFDGSMPIHYSFDLVPMVGNAFCP